MFKKLKDKIAEEVRQAPLRLPASVQQQLSQTLVDIAEDPGGESGATQQFSIGDDEDSPGASPSKQVREQNNSAEFQQVSLTEPQRDNITSTPQPNSHPTGKLSRQSSLNSLFSDVSFFQSGDSYHPYQFQSDLESNVSELDESASGHHIGDRISKEQIYNAYQKTRTRYHKYKGRYADLAKHYKDLEREREKVKNILVETQDRSLRRIAELREQCALEQQAKAHLEENLRSDLEEKDNIIAVLQTKVKLLTASGTVAETISNSAAEGVLVDLSTGNHGDDGKIEETTSKEQDEGEIQVLKDKLQRFESLLIKCKENIKGQKERIAQLLSENETAKRCLDQKQEEVDKLHSTHKEQLAHLTDGLNLARKEIETLRHQEQDAALAAAETKQKVHEELLTQEAEMMRLRAEREQFHAKVAAMEAELNGVREEMSKQLETSEMLLETEKQKLLQELSRGKTEALKLMEEDMDRRLEELKSEKDAHWEAALRKKIGEAEEAHQRALRLAEEEYRARLAELQEEKSLAMEEKELHVASLLAQERNNHQGLQDEIAALKERLEEAGRNIEKIKEESLSERRSWVQQIEDNRQRHLEEVQSLKRQHHQQIDDLAREHQNAIDSIVLNLKDQHREQTETMQRQHEELLQAANEDLETSAKSQVDQLMTMLREKETELSKRSASISQLEEQLESKGQQIDRLESQLQSATEQLEEVEKLRSQLSRFGESLEQRMAQIEQLEQRVSDLQTILTEKETVIQSNEQYNSINLETIRQLEESISRMEEEAEKNTAEREEMSRRSLDTDTTLKALEEERNTLQEQLIRVEAEHKALAERAARAEELAKASGDQRDELAVQLKKVEQKLQLAEEGERNLERKLSQMEASRSVEQEERSRLEGELDTLKAQASLAQDGLNVGHEEHQKIADELARALEKVTSAEEERKKVEKDLIRSEENAKQMETELQEIRGQLSQAEEARNQAEAGRQTYEDNLMQIGEKLNSAEASRKNAEDELEAARKELEWAKEELHRIDDSHQRAESQLNSLKEKLSEEKAKRVAVEQNLNAALTDRNKLDEQQRSTEAERNTFEEKWKQAVEEQRKQVELLQRSLDEQQTHMVQALEGRISSLKKELEEQQLQTDEAASLHERAMNQIASQLNDKDAALSALRGTLESKEQLVVEAQNEVESLRQQIHRSSSEREAVETRVRDQTAELDDLRRQLQQANEQKDVAENSVKALTSQLEAARVDKASAAATIQELERVLVAAEKSYQASSDEVDQLTESLSVQKMKIDQLENELEREKQNTGSFSEELDVAGRRQSELERTCSELELDKTRLEASLAEATTSHNASSIRLQSEIDAIRSQLRTQETELLQQSDRRMLEMEKGHQATIRELEARVEEILKEADHLRIRGEQLAEQLKTSERETVRLRTALSDSQSEWESKVRSAIQDVTSKAEGEKDGLELSLASCNSRLEVTAEDKKTLEAANQQLASEIRDLKAQLAEVTALTEEKNRLDVLCKRLKVQLNDTKKMLVEQQDSKESQWKEKLEVAEAAVVQLKEELAARKESDKVVQGSASITQNGEQASDLLQQQLVILQRELDTTQHRHKLEVAELRRLIEIGKASSTVHFHGSLEEATELEYLRNILFEYMMGRQATTLAKVIAAVVKFTPDQTRKVIDREEQRQSLLGHLGFA